VQVPTLSDGTNTFTVFAGLFDTLTGTSVDGCYFSYTNGTNSGAWSVTTVSNSTSTGTSNVTSGITLGAGTWYRLKIVVNAAGTNVDYYIDDVLKVTHTTNIPTGTTRATGFGINILKSASTTARFFNLDYVSFRQEVTR
jgi:hypothetical protein